MIIHPHLTKAEIEIKISAIEVKLDDMAEVGDEILSAGATVKYNNRYNHYKRQLEQLYSMLTQKINRGEI